MAMLNTVAVLNLLKKFHRKIWDKVCSNVNNSLKICCHRRDRGGLRSRGHQCTLPSGNAEKDKRCFVNRCLLQIILNSFHLFAINSVGCLFDLHYVNSSIFFSSILLFPV